MAKVLLVGPDAQLGEEVLQTLDAAGFPPSVALWLYEEEEGSLRGEWTLLLASPVYDKAGPREAFHQLVEALRGSGRTLGSLPIRLEGHKHPLIKALRKLFGKTASVEGMRLGGHSIGGVWVADAYVYRIR
jgi:hypothetical protein